VDVDSDVDVDVGMSLGEEGGRKGGRRVATGLVGSFAGYMRPYIPCTAVYSGIKQLARDLTQKQRKQNEPNLMDAVNTVNSCYEKPSMQTLH